MQKLKEKWIAKFMNFKESQVLKLFENIIIFPVLYFNFSCKILQCAAATAAIAAAAHPQTEIKWQ